ncbi:S-adenosyl-L-methionine-dependent methyltransferase [Mycena filopes]|nr:S-adenosyl-L-methionine-dependent methyltransferase [Mycena filopes]
MPPPRPTAFEVSFPEEAAAAALDALRISQTGEGSSSSPLKRKGDGGDDEGLGQQRASAQLHRGERRLCRAWGGSRAWPEYAHDFLCGTEPTRVLHNFSIFEPATSNELVSLDVLEIDDDKRTFAAAGVVLLPEEDDEDFGQEDGAQNGGVEDEEMDVNDYVRLGDIKLYPFDYFNDAPIFLETNHAFYELRGPSTRYSPYFLEYYNPRLAARAILTNSRTHPREGLKDFVDRVADYTVDDLDEAVPHVLQVRAEPGHGPGNWRNSSLIQDLMRRNPSSRQDVGRRHLRALNQASNPRRILGNPDLALLRPENQSPTHVTPLIGALAEGYFHEDLEVVGPPSAKPNIVKIKTQKDQALRFLKECIARVRAQEKKTLFSTKRTQYEYGRLVEAATVGGEVGGKVYEPVYKTGDFVCIRKGHYRGVPAPLLVDIPNDAKLADYFWFARIVYFNVDTQQVHVQWLEHGSQIILKEFAHPQELFLNMLCEDQRVAWIGGKISVHYSEKPPHAHDHYFVRSVYDERDASFTSLDQSAMSETYSKIPPENCLPCSRADDYVADSEWNEHVHEKITTGIKYQRHNYHVHEFFLYNAITGPANIGYINEIQIPRRRRAVPKIHFTKVGRMRDLAGVQMEEDGRNLYPERHLFLTNEKASVLVNELVRPIHVYAWAFFLDQTELKRWVDYSPYNFYCSYRLPSLTAEPRANSWNQRVPVPKTMNICGFCPSAMYRCELGEAEFDAEQARTQHTCLDLFGGTGAFSHAIAEGTGGCTKPTHLIEITPSAARTAQRNSPNLVTYCQDANVMLRYFIKSAAEQHVEVPVQLWDNKTPVPAPLPPNKPMTIVAGLPCQSHSGLNMFRKAEDRKSNLILTAASYVDFFRPDFFFLENVPGFLKYNLLAEQAGPHRVEGGLEMGGLKLMLRALLDMQYQIRFSLIQAGNYGAPQNRVRFFLIAARHGLPLPAMPQPTHDFEVTNQLRMRLPYNHRPQVVPIRTTRGRAAHASVSIEDAIGDLPPFDWKHPDPGKASVDLRRLQRARKQVDGIPVLACVRENAHCGFEGIVAYRHDPKTSFQREARVRPVIDIQHYTRCLLPKTVERVITIPLTPGADFRSLPDSLAEWQFSNPVSAVGRNRYRGSLYGRLDKNGSFPTTVTNMHPTAKQSKVLHPEVLTVREFARSQGFPDWFVFVSVNDSVVTLHRQIGNAVPWQVSLALGRELRIAMFEDWKKRKAREPPEEDVEMG